MDIANWGSVPIATGQPITDETPPSNPSPELAVFWDWWPGPRKNTSKTRINFCRRFIKSNQKKLESEQDKARRSEILSAISEARHMMGMELDDIHDPSAERELNQAVAEAREAGYPEQSYNALHGLALFYGRHDDFATAIFLYMQSTAYAGDRGYVYLLFDRISYALLHGKYDKSAIALIDEWRAAFDLQPLGVLLQRANRMHKSSETKLLEIEATHPSSDCWHIGKAVAACFALGRLQDAVILANQGLEISLSTNDEIWQRSFAKFTDEHA